MTMTPGHLGICTATTARGGSEEYIIALARWATSKGWRVTVVMPDVDGVRTVRDDLRSAGMGLDTIDPPPPGFSECLFPQERRRVIDVMRAQRFDRLVLVLPGIEFGGALIDAAAVMDIPAVVLYQLAGYPYAISEVERQFYAWARRRRQTWAAVSIDNRDRLCDTIGWARESVEVVPNGVLRPVAPPSPEARQAARVRVRDMLHASPTAALGVTVARLHPQKGVDVWLDAAAALVARSTDLHLVWIGDGELRGEVTEAVRARGLSSRVHLPGRRTDVDAWLHAADVFMLPSRFEGCPFAALEALAAGCPTVLSDIGPHREIVSDGVEGVLVPVNDAAALALATARVLDDPVLAQRLRDGGRRRARDFSPEASFGRLWSLLDRATQPTAPPWPSWPLPSSTPRRRTAIYGVGAGGRVAFDELQMKEDVVAFVDSFHDGSPRMYCDRPVVTPEALVTIDPDHVVLASCWHPAMRERLSQVGIAGDRVEVFPQWRLVSIDAAH